jgi:hypothetical protein
MPLNPPFSSSAKAVSLSKIRTFLFIGAGLCTILGRREQGQTSRKDREKQGTY